VLIKSIKIIPYGLKSRGDLNHKNIGPTFDLIAPLAKLHAWGVHFYVFWACHALHAQNFRGVIMACLAKKYTLSNALLGRQSTEYFPVQFRATFVTFSGRGVLLLRRASTNKVLDATRRGDNFSVVCPQTRCATP